MQRRLAQQPWRDTAIATIATAVACALTTVTACSGPPRTPALTGAQRLNAEAVRRLDRGDLAGAESALREALQEAELVDDLAGQSEAWNNLGATATASGKLEEAAACYRMALQIAVTRSARDAHEVRVRTNLGGVLLAMQKYDLARTQLDEAIKLSQQINQPKSAFLARAALASLTLATGDATRAQQLANSLADEARAAGDDEAAAAALHVEGVAFNTLGDRTAARTKLESALALDRKRENPIGVRSDLRALASIAENAGLHELAASYFGRASRVSRRLGDLQTCEQELVRAVHHAKAAQSPDLATLEAELRALQSRSSRPLRPITTTLTSDQSSL